MIVYFSWWYGQGLIDFWQAITTMTEKLFSFFSVKLLLSTLFDPWKRDNFYVENASLDIRMKIWFNNLVSRFIGVVIRLVTIFLGLFSTVLFFAIMILVFLSWIFLPVIALFLIINGIRGGV